MIRNPVLICLCVFVCIPACASGQTAPAAVAPVTTIHTSSDLVVVDVVASDSQQNPVHQLTAADFTVLEDGKPQTVKSFEEHATSTPAPPRAAQGELRRCRRIVTPTVSPVPATGVVNVLLLDALNTPMDAHQAEARKEMIDYLKEIPSGTPIAIFTLASRPANADRL